MQATLSRQQRLGIAHRDREVRASEVSEHGYVYGDDFAFGIKQRTARPAVSCLSVIDDLVSEHVADVSLSIYRPDQVAMCQLGHQALRVTAGVGSNGAHSIV